MEIIIQKAKNGEDTATADGHFLHSNYAPEKEAERFVQNLSLPYNPSSIIITEPALSYSAKALRKRFPDIKLGAIRYTPEFSEYDSFFDFVFNYYEHPDFEVYLESKLTEEELLSAFFVSWQPSSQVFKDTEKAVWQAIKAALVRSKTLLYTRQYFEKKWLLNSCRFIKYLKNPVSLNAPVQKDALIIASGPSLKPYLNFIKENQNSFFIICLSSAISVCLENDIIPDLCMSTDGGFWAGEHLKKLRKTTIPLAMPAEAYCSKGLFSKLKILPLIYDDGISSELLKNQKLECKRAVRNGTVSGTALLFAVQYCTKNIFFCGLDLAPQKGFQHTQPNELERNSVFKDNRLNTKEGRLARAGLPGGSLDIYREWFASCKLSLGSRTVFRVIEPKQRKNTLGEIKDIDLKDFSKLTSNEKSKENFFEVLDFQKASASSAIKLLSDKEYIDLWKKQLFPLDYVQLSHNPANTELKEKIEVEWKKLKSKAEEILNEDL